MAETSDGNQDGSVQEDKLEEDDEAPIKFIFQEVIRIIIDEDLDDDNDNVLFGLNSGETLNFGSKKRKFANFYFNVLNNHSADVRLYALL
ncbi:hypothetical protein Tco_1516573 [Tanacetum coccineum]